MTPTHYIIVITISVILTAINVFSILRTRGRMRERREWMETCKKWEEVALRAEANGKEWRELSERASQIAKYWMDEAARLQEASK